MRRPVVGTSDSYRKAEALRQKTLTFTIDVTVDPSAIADALNKGDRRTPHTVVADEITSSLESVSYVNAVTVRRKTT